MILREDGWVPVVDQLPVCQKVNGFWESIPVIVAKVTEPRITGAYFTYHGGDDVYPDDPKTPEFAACGGLPMNVVFWRPMPEGPAELFEYSKWIGKMVPCSDNPRGSVPGWQCPRCRSMVGMIELPSRCFGCGWEQAKDPHPITEEMFYRILEMSKDFPDEVCDEDDDL